MKRFFFSLAMVFAACCIPGQAVTLNLAVKSSLSKQTNKIVPVTVSGKKCKDAVITIITSGDDGGLVYC